MRTPRAFFFESLDTPVLRDAEARLRKVMEGRS